MKFNIGYALIVPLLLSLAALESRRRQPPQIRNFPSGQLHLQGFLWKPPGPGPFPAVLFNHGSGGAGRGPHRWHDDDGSRGKKLGLLFVKHGYAFFYPCRRGRALRGSGAIHAGSSAEGGGGQWKEARLHLQLSFTTTEYLNDELAGLAFLENCAGD